MVYGSFNSNHNNTCSAHSQRAAAAVLRLFRYTRDFSSFQVSISISTNSINDDAVITYNTPIIINNNVFVLIKRTKANFLIIDNTQNKIDKEKFE